MSESDNGGDPTPAGRSLFVFLPLLFFAALVAFVFVPRLSSGVDPSRVPSAMIGKPVPSFTLDKVDGLDRPALASADLKTGQVTLINVFASWCLPCRQEQASLLLLSQLGTRIVGIAYKDKPDNTRRFLGQDGDPYQAVGADPTGRVAIDFGVYGVPETYVVKGDGTIVYKIVGPLTDGNIKSELMPAIDRAKTPGS